MKVSIITIGLCIFYFTASSASPSPQRDINSCYCKVPHSEKCRNRRIQNGCSLTDSSESSFTTTGKFAYNHFNYIFIRHALPKG